MVAHQAEMPQQVGRVDHCVVAPGLALVTQLWDCSAHKAWGQCWQLTVSQLVVAHGPCCLSNAYVIAGCCFAFVMWQCVVGHVGLIC